jgi:hypothetical protein
VARERAGEARAIWRKEQNLTAVKREAREVVGNDASMTFGRVGTEFQNLDSTTNSEATALKHAWR